MASERDAGLVRAVGRWGLTANIIGIVIGAGIFAVPGEIAAAVGGYAPLAFVACAAAIAAIAMCFAEGGSRMPTSGGAFGYIEFALGGLAGYVCGTLLWVGDLLACGGVAAALAQSAANLVPTHVHVVRDLVIVAVIGGIAFANIGGVARGARLVDVTTVLKLLPLLVFVIVGATAIHVHAPVGMAHTSATGFGRAVLLAMFSLMGMEAALCTSGEIVDAARAIPFALAVALTTVTALYVTVQLIAQGILGPALAGSTEPLAQAMGHIHPALRALMLAGGALSMFGWISGDVLSSPRMLFAFARRGLLPAALGRTHARSHAPHVAIACYALLAMTLALSGTFDELAVLSALTSGPYYIATCVAAWLLARRGIQSAGPAVNFRWLGGAALIGSLSMLALMALASRAEILGLAALIGASAAIYALQTALR